MFPSLCLPALQAEVMAAWIRTSFQISACRDQQRQQHKIQSNRSPDSGCLLGQLPCTKVQAAFSSLLPKKVTLEQTWISMPSDLQLQYRHSQKDWQIACRQTELISSSTEAMPFSWTTTNALSRLVHALLTTWTWQCWQNQGLQSLWDRHQPQTYPSAQTTGAKALTGILGGC